jgi:hypothetical protein
VKTSSSETKKKEVESYVGISPLCSLRNRNSSSNSGHGCLSIKVSNYEEVRLLAIARELNFICEEDFERMDDSCLKSISSGIRNATAFNQFLNSVNDQL